MFPAIVQSFLRSLNIRLSISILLGWLVAVSSGPAQTAPHIHLPPGFAVELAAGEPQVKYPMFAVFDERGRLLVAESSGLDLYDELQAQTRKCRIRLLEDRDEDGTFETSGVFADELVFPMGLAWRGGKLYVADPPDLVVFEDTNDDGAADTRSTILTGFGHRDNGSLHGLIFGPDGWLYMTMGSPDGYRLRRADGSFIEGESGALIRCRTDGSDPQVLCRGFENLVEVVFTPRGEIFGTDNWFRNVNQPGSNGLRDALVHLVEGGLYPYHAEVGTPQPVTGDPLEPMSLFPAVALSGLVRYEGATFPEEFHGNLFSAQHNSRKVGRHVVRADGSTFRTEDFDFLTCDDPDFHPSDVLMAADGSLLVVDTGSWYVQHCPTGRIRQVYAAGGIYRVRREGAAPIDDPWGNEVDWRGAKVEQLIGFLEDRRHAVRDRASGALVERGEHAVTPLVGALRDSSRVATRQRILWSLANMGDDASREALRSALTEDDDVAATTARALAGLRDVAAADALENLLSRDAPHVRLAAAEALAHCGRADSLAALWQVLAGGPDRFVEHAVIHAAHRLARVDDLLAALRSQSPRVQQAALLLLNQPPRPSGALAREAVLARVSANDADLRRTAIRLLREHREWTDAAIALTRRWLRGPQLSDEERSGVREMILALESETGMQGLSAEALADPAGQVSTQGRVAVLESLAASRLPTPPAEWVDAVATLIDHEDQSLREAAVHVAVAWNMPQFDEPLARIAGSPQPVEIRLAALGGVIARRARLNDGEFEMLVGELADAANPLGRLRAAEVAGRGTFSDEQLTRLLDAVRDDPLISPTILLPAIQRSVSRTTSAAALDYLASALRHGWRPAAGDLRAAVASISTDAEQTGPLLEIAQHADRGREDLLASYDPLLREGDPRRGREVFFGSKVACGSCHRVGAEGGSVGPDLTRIGSVRSVRDLLESIVFPSSSFAQGYENYLVTTTAGRVVMGTLAEQSPRLLVLGDSSGGLHRIAHDDIETMDRHTVSLMPDGLAAAMTREEFQDLLAYLQSLK